MTWSPITGVTFLPEAIINRGIEGMSAISGTGLNTFGFLWDLESIWSVYGATPTTTWTAYGSTPVTTWLPFGI